MPAGAAGEIEDPVARREPLRNDADEEELADILSQIWLQRADRYSELRRPELAEAHVLRKVEMYRIGG